MDGGRAKLERSGAEVFGTLVEGVSGGSTIGFGGLLAGSLVSAKKLSKGRSASVK